MRFTGSSQLCLECGLCCNGVIFANGLLKPGDDVERLQSLGLTLISQPARKGLPVRDIPSRPVLAPAKFLQPCPALEGCRCGIYEDRPKSCREFECLLLRNVKAGEIGPDAALRIIRQACERAETVRGLLRELGDRDEAVALRLRFLGIKRRLARRLPDEKTAELYGQLTLAVHALNLLLAEAFYSE